MQEPVQVQLLELTQALRTLLSYSHSAAEKASDKKAAPPEEQRLEFEEDRNEKPFLRVIAYASPSFQKN